jgi:hypothetical protein
MYLRFVVPTIHKDSGRELGVFQALGELRRQGKLDAQEEEQDNQICEWFDRHLKVPPRFTASKPPYYRKQKKAISKETAHEHIVRMRLLAEILRNHGVPVRMLKSKRVGYIVYEDEHQIVAEPFTGD